MADLRAARRRLRGVAVAVGVMWLGAVAADAETLTVTKVMEFSGFFADGLTNRTVLAVRIQDSSNRALKAFRVRNLGTLTNGEGPAGVPKVKLWQENGTNNGVWSSEDLFVCRLYWSPTAQAWTNGTITHATQLGGMGKVFLVTVDLSPRMAWSNTFRAAVPAGGVESSGGATGGGVTNAAELVVPPFLPQLQPMGGSGLGYASVAWGDYDNDGDLDLAVSGYDGSVGHLKVYRNDGDGAFVDIAMSPAFGVFRSSLAWGDMDNDGDLDLVVQGHDGTTPQLRMYRNDSAVFHAVDLLPGFGMYDGSLALADWDGDGDLDAATAGFGPDGSYARLALLRNDGTDGFVMTNLVPPGQGIYQGGLAWGDYDGDGDQDLAVVGEGGIAPQALAWIFRNDLGVFTNIQALGAGYGRMRHSSSAWGDYDNDGDLDLAVMGWDPTVGFGVLNRRLILWRNEDAGFVLVELDRVWAGIYPALAWGDYDNDGDLDLALVGEDAWVTPRFRILRNDGGETFTDIGLSPAFGVEWASLAWADHDNDGDIDLALAGIWSGYGYVLRIYANLARNGTQPPSPVSSGFSAEDVGGHWRLRWNPATDDRTPQKALRYQVAVGTNSGQYRVASMSVDVPSGQANPGKVTVVTGMPWYQTRIPATKTVYWRVCAIDAAFKASAWSAEQVHGPGAAMPPAKVSAVHPASNARIRQAAPTFVWTRSASAGVAGYRLWLDGLMRGMTGSTSLAPAGDLAEGSHQWSVVVVGSNGLTNTSGPWGFTVDLTPPSFGGTVWPPDGAVVTTNRPVLAWLRATDANGVTNYLVYLDGGLAATVPHPVTNWQVATALSDGSHTWRVVAVDRAGNTNGSAPRSFIVMAGGLAPPGLVQPASNATVTSPVAFRWTRSPSAALTNYRLIVNGSVVTTVPWTVTNAVRSLSDGVYTWQVRVVDRVGRSNESAVRTVTVDTTPPADVAAFDVVRVPTGGGLVLSWSGVAPDAVGLRLVRKTGSAPAGPADGTGWDFGPVEVTAWTDRGLTDGVEYHYGLFSRDAAGNWSAGVRRSMVAGDEGAVAVFELVLSKNRIEADGADTATVSASGLRYRYTGLTVEDGRRFLVRVVEGQCELTGVVTGSNGERYVVVSGGALSFGVRGRRMNLVRLAVRPEWRSGPEAEVKLLIGPEPDLRREEDAIPLESVVERGRGVLTLALRTRGLERLRIRLYEMEEGERVMEKVVDVAGLEFVDVELLRGLKPGLYAMVVDGRGWRKRFKVYLK